MNVLALFEKSKTIPLLGTRVFDWGFSRKAPYFGSISPRFTVVEANHAELVIKNRRAVHNHIGKGMTVHYTAKADSDITCIAETNPEQWTSDDPDPPVRVRGVRVDGTVVIEGEIRLWVADKPKA